MEVALRGGGDFGRVYAGPGRSDGRRVFPFPVDEPGQLYGIAFDPDRVDAAEPVDIDVGDPLSVGVDFRVPA